jgi:hypothetical protein
VVSKKDMEQDGRLDAGDQHDADQDQRISNLESGSTAGTRRDAEQDARLQNVEHNTDGVQAELPGVNTPTGAQQRLKLNVPTPLTLVTLGAIGNADAGQHKVGPGGFALKTVESFAAEVHQHTIIDTDHNVIVHTPENITAVAGQKLFFSTNGDYKLGAVGALDFAAASGAGFADPAFTVEPQMAVPAPPAIDTSGPRAATEGKSSAWSAIWKAWDAYSGVTSLAKIRKDGLAKGLGKDTFAAKTSGLYSVYNNSKKVVDGLWAAVEAAIAAFNHSNPSQKPAGPGKPKITMYADDGVSILSPEKVALFSSVGGVDIGSPHKVSVKAGVSGSIKAGCDASLFAFVSAKIESKMVAAVKGKIVAIDGELTEVKGSQQLMINSKGALGIEADGSMRVSSKAKLEVSAHEVIIGSDLDIGLESEDILVAHAKNQANLWGDEKAFIKSDKLIEALVKKSGLSVKDGEVRAGCDDKVGMKATSSQCNVGTQSSYTLYKDSGFELKGGGASKIKAPNISIG